MIKKGQQMYKWFNKQPIRWVVLLGACMRLGLWWGKFGRAGYRHLFRDDEVYWQAAQSFLETGQFNSPKVMPVLPLLEATLGFPGIIYHNIIIGTALIWVVYQLGKHLFNPTAALWAAAIVAISPGLLYFSNHAYTEIPFTFLLVLGVLQYYRGHYWRGHIAWGMSILLRPTLDLFVPVWVIATAVFLHKKNPRQTALHLGQYALVYVLMLAPWWGYNYQQYGQFVRLNLGAGEVMYHGQVNLPQLDELDDPAVYSLRPYADIEDPFARDSTLKSVVWAHWTSNPVALPIAIWRNGTKFWFSTPEVFYGAFKPLAAFWSHGLLLLTLIACLAIPDLRSRKWLPIGLLVLYFTAVHSLLHGMPRYRLPLEPFLAIMAGGLLGRLLPGIFKEEA
ncbi:MAG: hypothetical protein AAFV07_00800 [Bacteroidota bacterium]